jgi:hypothetical protein
MNVYHYNTARVRVEEKESSSFPVSLNKSKEKL